MRNLWGERDVQNRFVQRRVGAGNVLRSRHYWACCWRNVCDFQRWFRHAVAINAGGVVTGANCDLYCNGFVRAADGTITRFDPEGSTDTEPTGINVNGAITGYSDVGAFLRKPNGTIITFRVLKSATTPTAINDSGMITGFFGNSQYKYGFIRAAVGTITRFHRKGVVYIEPYAINANGDVTGYYFDSSHNWHGFLRTADGTITTFDVKGVTGATFALAINRKDAIAGYCGNDYNISCKGLSAAGFERTPGGKIRTFDPKSSARVVYAAGINDSGVIAGSYCCGKMDGDFHGFVGSPKSGFTSFDPPDSIGTTPSAINADGDIAGSYDTGAKGIYGFIRTP